MTGMCDPELDELLLASDRSLSFAIRKRYLDQAQSHLAATSRMLPLYYNVLPEVLSKRVRNYRGSGTNFGSFWNLYEWQLTQ
jgi:ABC-type transport system substrate-binding protein